MDSIRRGRLFLAFLLSTFMKFLITSIIEQGYRQCSSKLLISVFKVFINDTPSDLAIEIMVLNYEEKQLLYGEDFHSFSYFRRLLIKHIYIDFVVISWDFLKSWNIIVTGVVIKIYLEEVFEDDHKISEKWPPFENSFRDNSQTRSHKSGIAFATFQIHKLNHFCENLVFWNFKRSTININKAGD